MMDHIMLKGTEMKKIASLLLILFLLVNVTPAFAEPAATLISDADDLNAIRLDPSGSYRLANDIDMSGVSWIPCPFQGQLDGAGHTLYNLHITVCGDEKRVARDGNLKEYETSFAGLFSVAEGAFIHDLGLRGEEISLETSANCFAAGIAGYLDHSTISGCSVEARISLLFSGIIGGTGGIAGYGCGTISDCKAQTELVFTDQNEEIHCEQFMGGVLSCGAANVDRNEVIIHGYDSCRGYVHNGGLVGMYYHCGMDPDAESVCDNSITGFIRFFEDNPDRRAYCGPAFGEYLQMPLYFHGNIDGFERQETWDYDTLLSPEMCSVPEIMSQITPPDCDSWGFTTVTCSTCGRSYAADYTPPAHTPGEWKIIREASYEEAGSEQLFCSECGVIMDERSIPPLVRSEGCSFEQNYVSLGPGETLSLKVTVYPDDAPGNELLFSSSDPSVVTVDKDGTITATGTGKATVHAVTADGFARASCEVFVQRRLVNWLMKLFA